MIRNSKFEFINMPKLAKQKHKYRYLFIVHHTLLTLFRMRKGRGGKKYPPTGFSPVTSTKIGIVPQNILTFSFNPFEIVM